MALPNNQSRTNWADSFKRMAQANDNKLLDENIESNFDKEEWEW